MGMLAALTGVGFLAMVGMLGMCLGMPGALIWTITAACIRWSAEGAVVSGDNLADLDLATITYDYDALIMPSSGNFLNVWLIIQLCMLGLCCACTLIGAICAKEAMEAHMHTLKAQ